jgi:hypothetical protein
VRRVAAAVIVAVAAGVVVAAVTVSIPGDDVKGAVTRVDFASKLLTVVGLLVGLTWALFKLVVSPAGLVDEIGETTYSNLKLELTCEVVAYRHDMRIVTFVVTLENVGKVPIRAGRPGCRLSVYEVPDDLPEGVTVAAGDGEALVDDRDLLAKYDPTSPYVIGPGVTYQESDSVVLAGNRVVSARATFHFGSVDEDAQTEYRLFRVD